MLSRGLWWGLNFSLIMPRGIDFSDSCCNFFQSGCWRDLAWVARVSSVEALIEFVQQSGLQPPGGTAFLGIRGALIENPSKSRCTSRLYSTKGFKRALNLVPIARWKARACRMADGRNWIAVSGARVYNRSSPVLSSPVEQRTATPNEPLSSPTLHDRNSSPEFISSFSKRTI